MTATGSVKSPNLRKNLMTKRFHSERAILFLVGAVQFINVLDFMMVMPLGPDFAQSLGIPNSHLGWIGGSYTAAASVAGLLASLFLDRLGRRVALITCLVGLMAGTMAGGFAINIETLIMARILAGCFGGPAASVSLSIVADVVPAERRGKAMGAVMGSFAIASILGVPAGLELARLGSWRTPFFAVGALGLVVALIARLLLPELKGHIKTDAKAVAHDKPALSFYRRPEALLSFLAMGMIMVSSFLIVPNVSAFLQFNLDYPRSQMGILYLSGGMVSFFTMRWIGTLTDRFGVPLMSLYSTLLLALVMLTGFVPEKNLIPIVLMFTLFMVANSSRNVSANTLLSKVPSPGERARFMSTQSAVQHMSCALGAFLSTQLLTESPEHKLHGISQLALFSVFMSMFIPPILWVVAKMLKAKGLDRPKNQTYKSPPAATSDLS